MEGIHKNKNKNLIGYLPPANRDLAAKLRPPLFG